MTFQSKQLVVPVVENNLEELLNKLSIKSQLNQVVGFSVALRASQVLLK